MSEIKIEKLEPHDLKKALAFQDKINDGKFTPTVTLIDTSHGHAKAKPRFSAGQAVNCNVIGRDESGAPTVAIRLPDGVTTDCAVVIRSYITGDIGKYACSLAPRSSTPSADKPQS